MTATLDSALWIAAAKGRVQEMKNLLIGGANVQERGRIGGMTPLHIAVLRDLSEAVQILLEHGADTWVKTSSGDSVLHLACSGAWQAGRGVIISSLFQNGADVHAQDKHGRTAFYRAIAYGSIQMVNMLLDCGADISLRDKDGYNSLHWAAHRRGMETQAQVVKILLARGTDTHANIANLSATTSKGLTPEQLAYSGELKELMRAALECHRETRRAHLAAFTLGQHRRLGASSHIFALSPDVAQLIMDQV